MRVQAIVVKCELFVVNTDILKCNLLQAQQFLSNISSV